MAVSASLDTSSNDPAEQKPVKLRKEQLPALDSLRFLAALDIVFFHFSNPQWFGSFTPIVNSGYTAVSFFFLLSGFILAYNYDERARAGRLKATNFWVARFSRLYPVYVLSLVISLGMLMLEWHARSHWQFALGLVLTPLMLQGWSPSLSTFWNTPAWAMSTEAFFYLIFPVVILFRRPQRLTRLLVWMGCLWAAAMVLPSLYMYFHPDGILHLNRYSEGFWIRALKYTPPPHIPAFLFGIALADVDRRIARNARLRLWMGLAGCAAVCAILYYGNFMPFLMMHDGLLMPFFGTAILGLSGRNLLAKIVGFAPLAFLGQASYCLYLVHFNLWIQIHNWHLWKHLGLARFDPWISYAVLVLIAVLITMFVEKPLQKYIRQRYLPSYGR